MYKWSLPHAVKSGGSTYIYTRVLSSRGVRRKLWNAVRLLLAWLVKDAECLMLVHGKLLSMPLSHELPAYLNRHENYDCLPGRIRQYLQLSRHNIKCIDVGANIGDSIAAFYGNDEDEFLAIEPNPAFYKYLVANWGSNDNVTPIRVICSSENANETFSIQEGRGTASIVQSGNGVRMTRKPLDEIIESHPEFASVDILKIDTDGHDFEVLEGAQKLILAATPAVLFECDAFRNDRYVEDCLETLRFFRGSGYNSVLIYDNFGYLMGKYPLSNFRAIQCLMFYQLTSPFYYFDILVMKDAELSDFFKSEVDYFTGRMPNESLRRTASFAVEGFDDI